MPSTTLLHFFYIQLQGITQVYTIVMYLYYVMYFVKTNGKNANGALPINPGKMKLREVLGVC